MAGTRRSSRLSQQGSSPAKAQDEGSSPKSARAGSKRKADTGSSPAAKRGKKATPKKEQKTIEETLNKQDGDKENEATEDQPKDIEMKDSGADGEDSTEAAEKQEEDATSGTNGTAKEQSNGKSQEDSKAESKEDDKKEPEKSTEEENPAEKPEEIPAEKPEEKSAETTTDGSTKTNGAIEKSEERGKAMPRNVVEKGIIYFVTRGRVGIDEPEGPEDLQRTFMVMRPMPKDAKLGDGAIQDAKNIRYIALPKKVLPQSHHDRFMAFVDKAKTSIEELKDGKFKGADNETKTRGVRHTPSITPVGEGVYEITSVGRSTHLLYMLTIPSELGEVQKDMGLREKGSFVISLKNPTRKGPANARLDNDPEFPEEIVNDFNGLAWMGVTKPEYLDYENAQLLLIGERQDEFGAAGESTTKDKKDETKESPVEELEKLEHEDELRVQHLDGDDSIFADLRLSHEEYSKVPTTW